MEEHPGSSRDINYSSRIAETATHQEYEETKYDEEQLQQQQSNVDDDQVPYVHDQLPNVEEVRIRAASALSMATHANRATTTVRLRSNRRIPIVPRTNRDCVWRGVFWAGLALMVIAIIVLVFGILETGKSESSSNTSLDRKQVEEFLVASGIATNEELQDTWTPQWDAVSWLVQLDGDGREPLPADGEDAAFFVQRYVLALLYYATNGQFWLHSRNLLRGDRNTCGWNTRVDDDNGDSFDFGAVCNEEGLVIKIYIPQTNLKGTMPRELGLLTKLEFLALHYNEVTGTLPSELQLLTNLDNLALHSNQLSGSIPSWIDQLTLLRVLGLGYNYMGGTLPSAIGTLTSLVTLGLDKNEFDGDLQYLQGLTNMRRLYLSGNSFTGPLDTNHLRAMRELEELDLSDNEFTGAVPIDMFSFPQLRILDLNDNNLSGPLPSGPYTDAPSLRALSLNFNDITGSISESIGDLTSLTHLDLASNEFTGIIPPVIQNLTNLSYLFLADNPFDESTFPDISRLTNLKDLSLKRTHIAGDLPALTQLKRLVMLDLDGNDLAGKIPIEWNRLTNLQYLFLNRNLGVNGTVPVSIQNLPSLSKSTSM